MTSDAVLVEHWRSMLTSYNEVACHLERALQDGHDLSMGEFETLDRLVDANCGDRRMQDLAGDMYLSQRAHCPGRWLAWRRTVLWSGPCASPTAVGCS